MKQIILNFLEQNSIKLRRNILQIFVLFFLLTSTLICAYTEQKDVYGVTKQQLDTNMLNKYIPEYIENTYIEINATNNNKIDIKRSEYDAQKQTLITCFEDLEGNEIIGNGSLKIDKSISLLDFMYKTDFDEGKVRKYNFKNELWEEANTQISVLYFIKQLGSLQLYDIDEEKLSAKVKTEELKTIFIEEFNTFFENVYFEEVNIKANIENNVITKLVFYKNGLNENFEISITFSFNEKKDDVIVNNKEENEEVVEEYNIGKYNIKDIQNILGYDNTLTTEEIYILIYEEMTLLRENFEEYGNLTDEQILEQMIEKKKVYTKHEENLFEDGITLNIENETWEFPLYIHNVSQEVPMDAQGYAYQINNSKFYINIDNGYINSISLKSYELTQNFDLNGIKLNYTQDDVINILGEPKQIYAEEDTNLTTLYYFNTEQKNELYINFTNGIITSIEVLNLTNLTEQVMADEAALEVQIQDKVAQEISNTESSE